MVEISHLLTVCIQYGIVSDSFSTGLLIPILTKEPNPTLAKNYRPVTVSVTLSKLLEYHMLELCATHQFSATQYGFIADRGCSIATALAHDIGVYANSSGSTVFMCALDAEGV